MIQRAWGRTTPRSRNFGRLFRPTLNFERSSCAMTDRGHRTPLMCPPVDGEHAGSDNAGMQRFYVSELHGYLTMPKTTGGRIQPGASCTVHDRAFNCRAVAVFRSEQSPVTRAISPHGFGAKIGVDGARLRAAETCARLNAAHEREDVSSDKGTGA